ncbi:hypothetical protein [Pseudarthrobacter sp. S9]|uniref:hypothetical protein n=1 Tax=Pseudarthrobacter sp. S9 TaxID=3418421 RepID=UPI003D06E948
MTKIVCLCGLDKVFVGNIAICEHCDRHCKNPQTCQRCKTYSVELYKRIHNATP